MNRSTFVEFPPPGECSISRICKPADIIGTYGHVRIPQDLWPPWGAATKAIAYHGIRKVQKNARYHGKLIYPNPDAWRITHIRIALKPMVPATGPGGRFSYDTYKPIWEVTHPEAQWSPITDLVGKEVIVCRPFTQLDLEAMIAEANRITKNESGYDVLELLSFAASALLGEENERWLRFDRRKRYVCSTGVAKTYFLGGGILPSWMQWFSVHPAMYASFPRLFLTYKINKAVL